MKDHVSRIQRTGFLVGIAICLVTLFLCFVILFANAYQDISRIYRVTVFLPDGSKVSFRVAGYGIPSGNARFFRDADTGQEIVVSGTAIVEPE